MFHLARATGALLLLVALIALLSLIPLPIPVVTDFITLYVPTVGLTRGIRLYDYAGQFAIAQQLFGPIFDTVKYPHYVYPPWFAYSLFFLGWLTPEHAARVWFWMNMGMLAGSVILITQSWSAKWRVIAFATMILSPAVISIVIVGQFTAPILFGIAIILYAATRQSAGLFVVGMLLLTLKPHAGLLPFVAAGGWLVIRRTRWQQRALMGVAGALIALLAGVTLAYPQWLSDYLAMLAMFRNLPDFGVCDNCSGGSILAVRVFLGYPFISTALYGGLVVGLLAAIWFLWATSFSFSIDLALYWSMLVACLAIPYFNNYDHIFSLLPFLWLLKNSHRRLEYWMLGMAFFLPWVGVVAQDRQYFAAGLVGQAFILFILMAIRLRNHHRATEMPVVRA
ncbi:glycosyltransferase family 87 protein [Chloroflexus sp.]|uniref:glycosyltransferase family 87 protein n=1 Tax=Chloroflexus sp. TaxID=1904827 RepID=UPI00298F05F8|nr:glycosyltransferase family 87 protein [Chloroflexus sp.]MDW8404613.1 glycosyltransferase family 87 protein [Chloroflexus sp.]